MRIGEHVGFTIKLWNFAMKTWLIEASQLLIELICARVKLPRINQTPIVTMAHLDFSQNALDTPFHDIL